MEFFSITINEDTWNIYLIPDDDNVISEETSAADTSITNKEMFFRKGEVTLKVIMHELFHAYFSYCYLADTTEMTLNDIEEVSASLFSDKAEKIIVKAYEIHKRLLELRLTDDTNN